MFKRTRKERRGFTLIEVLIVVVILGILAATVLPQFASTNDEAKESAVVQSLQTLRSQIQLYRFQHEGNLPSAADLEQKLTSKTKIDGTVNASGEFGPYILGQLPPNPFNGLRSVAASAGSPILATDIKDDAGWIYDATTGNIKASTDRKLKDLSGTSQTVFDL